MEGKLREFKFFLLDKLASISFYVNLFIDIYILFIKTYVNLFCFFFRKPKIINLNINKRYIKSKIYLDPKNGFLDKYIYTTGKWDDLNTRIIVTKLKKK